MKKAKKGSPRYIMLQGIIKENPTFVLFLGMCPTLGVTTTLDSALGMGLSVVFVLMLTNFLISLIRKIVPDDIRIPVYIVVIATVVTILEAFLQAYVTPVYESLGIFLPLIIVNCIILGRAEAFASKNSMLDSVYDGLGMGLGFTLGLSTLAFFRELLGTGSIGLFGVTVFSQEAAFSVLKDPSGSFLMLGILAGIIKTYVISEQKKKEAIKQAKIAAALERKRLAEEKKALAAKAEEPAKEIKEVKEEKVEMASKILKEAV
jgi:electron transport complex protein RnfE